MSATGHPTAILDELEELIEADQNTYEITTPAEACNALRAGADQNGDRA